MRERVQLLADQADHEFIVVSVEPVTSQAYVVRQICLAVGTTDAAVLAHDRAAFARIEALERADAPERVPNRPRPRLIQHGLARAAQQPKFQILLEAGRVCAAEHAELGAGTER